MRLPFIRGSAPRVFVFALLVEAACSSPAPPPPKPCWPGPAPNAPPGQVELGTGDTMFEPITPEERLRLVHGPQGGHHFVARARTRNMNARADSFFTALDEHQVREDIFQCPYRFMYDVTDADGYLESSRGSVLLIMKESVVPMIPGSRVLLRVEVLDSDGRYAKDERWIVAYQQDPIDAGVMDPPDGG